MVVGTFACVPEPGVPLEELAFSEVRRVEGFDVSERAPEVALTPTNDARLVRPAGYPGIHEVWIAGTARPGDARDPVVVVPKAYVTLAAYVDGVRVHALSDYRAASGMPLHVIPLPIDRASVPVLFRVASRYTQVGLAAPPRVGERTALLGALVARDVPRFVLAIVFLFTALVSAALAPRSRERNALAGIAFFCLGMGSWSLFQTRTHTLFVPSGAFWFGLWWVAPMVASLGVALVVDVVFGSGWRRFATWFWRFYAVMAVVSALSLVVPDESFETVGAVIFTASRAGLLFGLIGVVAIVVGRAREGDAEAQVFLGGFTLAALGVLHDLGVSLHLYVSPSLYGDFAYSAVGIALVVIVRRRLARLEDRLAAYAASLDRFVRERDVLVRDLHDGIGGVVSNLRLLAERARRRGGDDEHARVLDAISELAREGVAEVRTLMAGFEALPETWRAAAAELRRAGSGALEAHDVEHRFEARLDPSAPRPELAVFVEIFRVHREALTNVVKHARASRVDVELVVDATGLSLSITDDGEGLAPTRSSDGTGRGLRSMHARARSLGGALEITRLERGTRVRLTVPTALRED
jgi:signal transduction histidine kinase